MQDNSPHTRSSSTEKWFTVWDEGAEKELFKIVPIATGGSPCYWIDNHAFLVWFDWNIQKFIVSV